MNVVYELFVRKKSSFEELFEKDNFVSIHRRPFTLFPPKYIKQEIVYLLSQYKNY